MGCLPVAKPSVTFCHRKHNFNGNYVHFARFSQILLVTVTVMEMYKETKEITTHAQIV